MAEVSLPALFSNHAVLQKTAQVPIWGKAAPGENVSVTLGDAHGSAAADASGKWVVKLDLSASGPGPFKLEVSGSNKLSVEDVLVGEVWVCSGQSNMEFNLQAATGAEQEIAASANPQLRHFKVKTTASEKPEEAVAGQWVVAAPATSAQFTAVGYFFGKRIQKELSTPVGLINSSWGGTCVEAWTRAEAMDADADLKAGKDKARKDYADSLQYATLYREWMKKYDREDRRQGAADLFAGTEVNTADWKTVTMPELFGKVGLPDSGAVWIRRQINVSPETAGHNIDLFLADIRDFNEVYWNGRKIGESDTSATERRYSVRFNYVTAGEATLAIRIFHPAGGAGIAPGPIRFKASTGQVLAGEWKAKAEYELPALSAEALKEFPVRATSKWGAQNVAGYLYNGMIAPLIPYAMRGVVWYQCEANWDRGYQYRTAFPLMIRDWRAQWALGDFPFYFCQEANIGPHPSKPGDDLHAELREAQTRTLELPKTGQAILIDIGEEGNIHPGNKQDVGDRLARIALAQTYGKTVEFSGPVYDSMSVNDNKATLHFQHAAGLNARPLPSTYQPVSKESRTVPLVRNSSGGELEGFSICGEDHKWQWATAKVEGETVMVWSDQVAKPVAVRYAWSNNPVCNLYNGAGLPAVPFRTDDFSMTSRNKRY